jgi:hypothetical protein
VKAPAVAAKFAVAASAEADHYRPIACGGAIGGRPPFIKERNDP